MKTTWVLLTASVALMLTGFAAFATPASCQAQPGGLACAGADFPLWLIALLAVMLVVGVGLVIVALIKRNRSEG